MSQKKLRKAGDIFLEIEPHLNELMDHGYQWGDLLALMHTWLMIHRPGDREQYTDGGHPEFFYGHPDLIRKDRP